MLDVAASPLRVSPLVVVLTLAPEATVLGDLTVVESVAAKFTVSNAEIIEIFDPQSGLNASTIDHDQHEATVQVAAQEWKPTFGVQKWPRVLTVFLRLKAGNSSWLHPLDLNVVPAWQLETVALAAKGLDLFSFLSSNTNSTVNAFI